MDSIKCLDGECYGDGEISFPALTSLTIRSMPNLERWTMVDSANSFPCLEHLEITECPKFDGIPKLPTLKSLVISQSNTTVLNSIRFLTSLTSLDIFGFAEVGVLPRGLLQNHKALKDLRIGSLPIRTVSNVLDNLSALESLTISGCNNLEFLPEDFKYLTSLKRLGICDCDGLGSFPTTLLKGLCSLELLRFANCKKLKPLLGPQEELPPALDNLVLWGLPELEYLPENVQLLTSLRFLRIYYCEKLKSLPDGLKELKSLRYLDIKGCTQLEKRCKKLKGEDWPKISHIPLIEIKDIIIQHLD